MTRTHYNMQMGSSSSSSSSGVWECQPFFYLSDNVGNAGVKRGTTPFAYM
jgi:hypothetical protein